MHDGLGPSLTASAFRLDAARALQSQGTAVNCFRIDIGVATEGFIANTPGWHSMGGRLTTGPAAITQILATIPTTFTYALGTDHQIYENAGTWAARTPGLTGWHRAG